MSEIEITFPKVHLDKMAEAAATFDARGMNKDAAESAFVARQLEFMRPGIYSIQYPKLKASSLIPFNMGVDTGANQYTGTTEDATGEVKVASDMSTTTPMVEVSANQVSTNIFSLRIGYQYSLQEARNAIFARQPLAPRKAMRTREIMERKLDDIAFLGESVTGIKGLFNQTGTTVYTVPATGSAASKTWDTKAADDILLDLNGSAIKIVVDTNEVEIPDTKILPVSSYALLSSRRIGDGTSSTVLKYFLDNSAYIKNVETSVKLESNSGWTGKRMVDYCKDPSRLEMIVSQPFEQLAPQFDGFMTTTLCHMRTAGVALYLPKSVAVSDGI